MQPRLTKIRTKNGEFVIRQWWGVDLSGLEAVGERVVVLPDQPAEMTSGGIYLTEKQADELGKGAETGVLINKGPGAWKWSADRVRPFDGRAPEIGDRVFFDRYAGQEHYGADLLFYRMMDDKAVGGLHVEVDADELARYFAANPPRVPTPFPTVGESVAIGLGGAELQSAGA